MVESNPIRGPSNELNSKIGGIEFVPGQVGRDWHLPGHLASPGFGLRSVRMVGLRPL